MADNYTCANCGGEFAKGQSDEAARAGYEKTFPGMGDEATSLVCDDCYKLITDWARWKGYDVAPPDAVEQ